MKSANFSRAVFFLSLAALVASALSCAPSEAELKESKIHYEMGILYYQEGDAIRSLQELVKANQLNTRDKHVWNALGLAYKERKLLAKAEEAFEKALGIDGSFSEAYNNLGVLMLDQRKYKEAIRNFEQAAKNIFYTTPELAHNNMGYAYQMLGDASSAEKNYREAISLNPSFPSAYTNLARLFADQKKYADAEGVLRKYLSVYDNHLEANFLLGKVLSLKGDVKTANEHLTKVIRLDPRSPFAALARDLMGSQK